MDAAAACPPSRRSRQSTVDSSQPKRGEPERKSKERLTAETRSTQRSESREEAETVRPCRGPSLRSPTRPFGEAQGRPTAARKRKSGCFAPLGFARGGLDDRRGKFAAEKRRRDDRRSQRLGAARNAAIFPFLSSRAEWPIFSSVRAARTSAMQRGTPATNPVQRKPMAGARPPKRRTRQWPSTTSTSWPAPRVSSTRA